MNISPSLIVFYNTGFGAPLSYYYPYNILEGTTCEITTDRTNILSADAVVFHLPDMGNISQVPKRPGQYWVLWCQESEENYPVMRKKSFMSKFDIHMTYQLSSDIVHGYFDSSFEHSLRQSIVPKSKEILLSMFISSSVNKSGRLEYVKELMKYVKVDSYGKILQNKKLANDNGRESKKEIISKYKFHLAFENALSRDYVTEKFYDALEVGTVPVYLGAPNIAELAPGNHCFINVRDFKSPLQLAKYLDMLNDDDLEYENYFEWKKQPFKEPFNTLIHQHELSLFHSLYEVIKTKMTNSLRN